VRRTLAAALLSVALCAVAGCDDLPGKPQHGERYVLPDAVKDFAELYGTNCAGCHGADGRLGPARALNDPLYLAFASDAELQQVGDSLALLYGSAPSQVAQ
jgi:cytochrome c oxidase cbb3-type subunit 3/ubiquinol-cytochrome c reductase cytochrome c subunit